MLQILSSPYREFGFFDGTIYVIQRLLQKTTRNIQVVRHDWMVQPISSESLLPKRFAQQYEIRQISYEDALLNRLSIPPAAIEWRKGQRAICLGVFRKQTLIGYMWLCFKYYDEDEVRCRLVLTPASHSVFDFDVLILPEHRSGLGFAALWNGVNDYLYQRGVRYTYSRINPFNQASARAHSRLGSKRTGSALYFLAGRLEIMCATISPWISITWRESQRPAVILQPDVLRKL